MFILLTNKTTHDLRKIYEINVLVNINVGEQIYYSQTHIHSILEHSSYALNYRNKKS